MSCLTPLNQPEALYDPKRSYTHGQSPVPSGHTPALHVHTAHMSVLLGRAVPGQRIHLALPKASGSLVRRARDTNKNKRLFLSEQEGSLQVSCITGAAKVLARCWLSAAQPCTS